MIDPPRLRRRTLASLALQFALLSLPVLAGWQCPAAARRDITVAAHEFAFARAGIFSYFWSARPRMAGRIAVKPGAS